MRHTRALLAALVLTIMVTTGPPATGEVRHHPRAHPLTLVEQALAARPPGMTRAQAARQFTRFIEHVTWVRTLAYAAAVEHAHQQAVATAQVPPVWDRLAQCESGGDWADTRGNFEGGLQFLRSTWLAMGGGRYAPHAYQATRLQQITVATRLQQQAGWGQWPACSRRLGLRTRVGPTPRWVGPTRQPGRRGDRTPRDQSNRTAYPPARPAQVRVATVG